MADPKHTYALVTEKGWVHAVFNDEDRANEQAAERSVPLDQVNPDKGLHCYKVVRYIPAESAKAEAQPAGTGWVSVEERLPSAAEQVLVVRQEPGAKPWVGPAWYRGPKRAGEKRRGDWEASPWGIVNDVTHWQPMPPPPEPRE